MQFSRQSVLFLHVPKTGGNFVTRALIDQSDDEMKLTRGIQDGIDRFELRGPATKSKHQGLGPYASRLGTGIAAYRVYAIARPPLQRLVSLYFSPHRWIQRKRGKTVALDIPDRIDLDEFTALIRTAPSIASMVDIGWMAPGLRLGAPARHASGALVELLDFARLKEDLQRLCATHGLSLAEQPGRPVNKSARTDQDAITAMQRDDLLDRIHASHHARDLAFFEGGD